MKGSRYTGQFLEIILSVLFFSIICAIVLQLFFSAESISEQSYEQTKAFNCAQSLCDLFRTDAELEKLLQQTYGDAFAQTKDGYTLSLDQELDGPGSVYTAKLFVTPTQAGDAGELLQVCVTVSRDGVGELCRLSALKYCPEEVAP